MANPAVQCRCLKSKPFMKLRSGLVFVILSSIFTFCKAGNLQRDSLLNELKKSKSDSKTLLILNELTSSEADYNLWRNENVKQEFLAKEVLKKNPAPALKKIAEACLANAITNIGVLYVYDGDNSSAIRCFLESAEIQNRIGNESGFEICLGNIAYAYNELGDIQKALEYNYKVLKMRERNKYNQGIAETSNNIALIYESQNQYNKAIEYLNRTLKIYSEMKKTDGLSMTYNNLGFVYSSMKENDKALQAYFEALKLNEIQRDTSGIGLLYGNIGMLYRDQKKPDQALIYTKRSLEIALKLKQKSRVSSQYANLGFIYKDLNNIPLAIENAKKGLELSNELGYPEQIKTATKILYILYKKNGNAAKALEMYELNIKMRDSILNESTKRSSIQNQFQYAYDKKTAADSIKNAEEKKVTDARIALQKAQLKQERTQRFALFGGLALLIAFSIFFYNRFKITQKQKIIIEKQKHLVDEKNEELNQQNEEIAAQRDEIEHQKQLVEEHQKEVTDSILYARRIQQALLASDKMLNENLSNHFVFFQPKDIVSGDFYWATKANNKFYFAIADSTGHGVPGAFMSLLNISFLNEAITEKHMHEPAGILNHVRNRLMIALQDDGSEEGGKDGMDCILLAFDSVNLTLDFACANNALLLIRDNELITFSSDRMPVGRGPRQDSSFTNQSLQLQKGDCVYAYTDGYADQFGGPKGKKFKYKPFEELLLKTNSLPAKEQTQILKDTLENWKGKLEQVDDILIVGIRV